MQSDIQVSTALNTCIPSIIHTRGEKVPDLPWIEFRVSPDMNVKLLIYAWNVPREYLYLVPGNILK